MTTETHTITTDAAQLDRIEAKLDALTRAIKAIQVLGKRKLDTLAFAVQAQTDATETFGEMILNVIDDEDDDDTAA